MCPPKPEDKIDLSSETGGQVLQFEKSELCAMVVPERIYIQSATIKVGALVPHSTENP